MSMLYVGTRRSECAGPEEAGLLLLAQALGLGIRCAGNMCGRALP